MGSGAKGSARKSHPRAMENHTNGKELLGISFDYPHPLVEIQEAAKLARIKIWGHRKNKEVKAESKRIIAIHTRNNGRRKVANLVFPHQLFEDIESTQKW